MLWLVFLALSDQGAAPPAATAPVPPPPPQAPAPAGPNPALDPWLRPPGAPITFDGQAPIDQQATAIAVQEGLGPGAAGLMLQYFRPRRIAVAPSQRGGYVFTVGEMQKVVSEAAFLDSYATVTGAKDLDRYRVDRPRPVGGIILAGGGIVVAYVAAEVALVCSTSSAESGLSGDRPRCGSGTARTSALIAVGGLVASVVGLVMLTQSQAGANDPDLHRIPFDQTNEIVQRYNLALLKRAATMVRIGDLQGLMATSEPPARPRPPAPPRLSLGPAGIGLTF